MRDYSNGPAPGFLRLWWGKGALFPIGLAVIAVFVTVSSYQSLKLGLAFDAEGVVVEAVATDRREKRVRRNDRTETDYYVTFRYVGGGATQSVEKKVSRTLFDALEAGATREIRYLASSPRKMEHTVGKTWRDGQVMRWISLALGLGALGVFWWTARSAVEALRARKFGQAENATAMYVDERVSRSKQITQKSYVLVWRDSHGDMGESLPSPSKNRYAPYAAGAVIEVFRDSRGKTWWVGDVGPRAAAAAVPDAGQPRS